MKSSFPVNKLCDGLENAARFEELMEYKGALRAKSIKYDRGFVHCVQRPGQKRRIDNVGTDEYIVFCSAR